MTQLTAEQVYASIIWSADVADTDRLLEVVDRTPKLEIIKVDRALVARTGNFRIIGDLKHRGLRVFFDDKVSEIPVKLEAVAKADCAYGPWMLNCMAGSASGGLLESDDPNKIEGLKRFADACHAAGVRPCAVTVLTSKPEEFIKAEFGRGGAEQVMFYVELLLACSFTDVVCSPLELPVLRSESRFDVLDFNTPGIRRATSSKDDQARVSTPAGALAAGATRLVIGRDITNSNDPAQSLDDIVAEVLAAQSPN